MQTTQTQWSSQINPRIPRLWGGVEDLKFSVVADEKQRAVSDIKGFVCYSLLSSDLPTKPYWRPTEEGGVTPV